MSGSRLRRRRSRLRGLCGRRATVGNRCEGDTIGSRPARYIALDPHPRRYVEAALSSRGELELQRRSNGWKCRPANPLAQRQDARGIEFDQRDALCAWQSRRLRWLGSNGLPRLELRRCAAVLSQVRGLPARRRPGNPRPGRSAEGRGLPDDSSPHPSFRRGRATGWLPVQQGPQWPSSGRRRLFADDPKGQMARVDRANLPEGGPKPP